MRADNAALDKALRSAIAQGLLPADASVPHHEDRAWPIVLLTALGAWLAVIPLLGVIGTFLGDLIFKSAGAYLVGVLVLAAALTVLRSRDLPLFLEQLAVPGLLVGTGSLGFGLFRDLPNQSAAAVLAAVTLGLAWVIAQPWLRVLLGAAAAVLLTMALTPGRAFRSGPGFWLSQWLALHGSLLVWLAALAAQRRGLTAGAGAWLAAMIESTFCGWLLALLAGLALWSGISFLAAGALGGGLFAGLAGALGGRGMAGAGWVWVQAASVALGLAAGLGAAQRWPSLRQAQVAPVGLVLAALCWFMPALGAVLMALAWTATSRRWLQAVAAAFAATWIVGSFYYQLRWPLVHKALVLMATAAALGLLWWLASRSPRPQPARAASARETRVAAWMAVGALATLGIANVSIWQKEALIAQGQKVFVELAPVDPRSLMQGDYMRLNYRLPGSVRSEPGSLTRTERPHVVAQLDARGVAQLQRIAEANEPLAAGEIPIELTPKGGQWTLVSDAWYFREGDGKRWAVARYGEFRVLPDGKALLVGLADAQLQAIPVRR